MTFTSKLLFCIVVFSKFVVAQIDSKYIEPSTLKSAIPFVNFIKSKHIKFPKKSEFESNSDYFKKMFSRNNYISILVPLKYSHENQMFTGYSLSYEVDKKQFFFNTIGSKFTIAIFSGNGKSVVGSNLYGATKVLKVQNWVEYKFLFSIPHVSEFGNDSNAPSTYIKIHSKKTGYTDDYFKLTIPCQPEDAKFIKDKFAVIIYGNIVYINKEKESGNPTMEMPILNVTNSTNYYIDYSTAKILFINTATNEILDEFTFQKQSNGA